MIWLYSIGYWMASLGQLARENSLMPISGQHHPSSTAFSPSYLSPFGLVCLENKVPHSISWLISTSPMRLFSPAYLIDGSTSHQVAFTTSPTTGPELTGLTTRLENRLLNAPMTTQYVTHFWLRNHSWLTTWVAHRMGRISPLHFRKFLLAACGNFIHQRHRSCNIIIRRHFFLGRKQNWFRYVAVHPTK